MNYYKALCIIFLSPIINELVIESRTLIKTAMAERPESLTQLQNILKNQKLNLQTLNVDFVPSKSDKETESEPGSESDSESDLLNDSLEEIDNNELNDRFKKGSIKKILNFMYF